MFASVGRRREVLLRVQCRFVVMRGPDQGLAISSRGHVAVPTGNPTQRRLLNLLVHV